MPNRSKIRSRFWNADLILMVSAYFCMGNPYYFLNAGLNFWLTIPTKFSPVLCCPVPGTRSTGLNLPVQYRGTGVQPYATIRLTI